MFHNFIVDDDDDDDDDDLFIFVLQPMHAKQSVTEVSTAVIIIAYMS